MSDSSLSGAAKRALSKPIGPAATAALASTRAEPTPRDGAIGDEFNRLLGGG